MTVIFFCLLLLLTVMLRFRFTGNSLFFRCLRRPFPAGLILFLLSFTICLTAQKDYLIFNGDIYSIIFKSGTVITTLWFLSFFISSSLLRTPITGMVLTPFTSNLRVDIYPNYVRASKLKNITTDKADKFAEDIEFLLSTLTYKKITFQSHLLTHGVRRIIRNKLNEKGISYKDKERKTPFCEIIILNLRYGGKTRYRLLSCQKHPNGFRVHRHGGSFIVRRQKT